MFGIVHMDGLETGEMVVSGRLMFAYVMNRFSWPEYPWNFRRVVDSELYGQIGSSQPAQSDSSQSGPARPS